jgi:hypothetical protein
MDRVACILEARLSVGLGYHSDDSKLVFDFSKEKGRVTCFVEKPY